MPRKKRKIVIGIDKKEKKPYTFERFPCIETKRVDLQTFDYVCHWPRLKFLGIERKTLPDFLSCVGTERARFDRCIERMKNYKQSIMVVEASYRQIYHGNYGRCQVTPQSVLGSIARWTGMGILVVPCETREASEDFTARYIYQIAKDVLEWSDNATRIDLADFDAPSVAQKQAMDAKKRRQ